MFDTVYISRPLPLAPSEAESTWDRWYSSLPLTLTHRVRPCRGLRTRPRVGAANADHLVLRHVRGTLWVLGRPVPVELELLVSSREATEVGLRPFHMQWPVTTTHYMESAFRVVQDVSDQIHSESRVPVPVAGPMMSDGFRRHTVHTAHRQLQPS